MTHSAKAGLGGAAGAGILNAHCESGHRMGERVRDSWEHSAKAGVGRAAGTGILDTLCKSEPRRGRGGPAGFPADSLCEWVVFALSLVYVSDKRTKWKAPPLRDVFSF